MCAHISQFHILTYNFTLKDCADYVIQFQMPFSRFNCSENRVPAQAVADLQKRFLKFLEKLLTVNLSRRVKKGNYFPLGLG